MFSYSLSFEYFLIYGKTTHPSYCFTSTAMSDAVNTTRKRPRRVNSSKKPKLQPEPNNSVLQECDDIEDINFNKDETLEIRASLLDWYDQNQRDLPWRRISSGESESERRAYAVWVSEVMLQQTRVQTVIGYFNRWMEKWPTVNDLAQASLEEVNEMWAGLGYYRRARFLLEGGKMIVEEGDGFPKTVSGLRKVKGIGDYTAGAIASIAFKEAAPVVDGNVVRVTSRLKAISANPKDAMTVKKFWKLAGQLVDHRRPGDFNQALMELGATICTPLNPKCSSCPISAQCHAFSLSRHMESVLVTDYPMKVVKAKQRDEFSAVSVVEILESNDVEGLQSNSKVLLVKRPNEGLLAGLWEFPSVLLTSQGDEEGRRKEIDKFLKSSLNLDPAKTCKVILREYVGEYTHVFSHIRLKMHIELLVLRLKGTQNILLRKHCKENVVWKYVDGLELASMGLTSGVRKVYSMIQKHKGSQLGSAPSSARTAKGSIKVKL